MNIRALKEEQKKRAIELREGKIGHKNSQRNGDAIAADTYLCDIFKLRREYRHKHIAYCMLRGRKYEEIERTCRDDNKPDMAYVQKLMDVYAPKPEPEKACA